MKWTIDQEVYVVRRYGAPCTARITKIGRKWITLDGKLSGRFDPVSAAIDGKGYASPGTVYTNADEYRAECELNAAWKDFATRIPVYGPAPEGMTMARIEAARVAIFGEQS